MSLNVFMGICVLACDFLIYAFFQWTFGEKRRESVRTHPPPKTAKKKAIEIAAQRPYIVGPYISRPGGRGRSEREVA